MKISFLVFKSFFLSWIRFVFVNNLKTKEHYAAHNLFQPTFRIPQADRFEFLLVLKHFYKFAKIFLNPFKIQGLIKEELDRNVFLYDYSSDSYKNRKAYIEHFSGKKVSGGIFKENLAHIGKKSNFLFLLGLNLIWLPFIFVHSLFKKDKAAFAILFIEQFELVNLLQLLKVNHAKELYYFCIYEKDSNIATIMLQKAGIQVSKIPSEVPLGIWNKIIIANTLCICNGYQFDEIKFFNKSVFVDKLEFYGPEEVLNNVDKYSMPVETHKKVIGFYSTGAWVRMLENHSDQGFDMVAAEENVKSIISEFCIKHTEYKLLIYLHPREKWEKYYQLTIDKYKKLFEGINYEFTQTHHRSSETFEYAELGVAFQSTIVYERLYYGFKTILMPLGSPNFPVAGSNMRKICAFNKEELFSMLEDNLCLSNKEFFQINGITHFAKYIYN